MAFPSAFLQTISIINGTALTQVARFENKQKQHKFHSSFKFRHFVFVFPAIKSLSHRSCERIECTTFYKIMLLLSQWQQFQMTEFMPSIYCCEMERERACNQASADLIFGVKRRLIFVRKLCGLKMPVAIQSYLQIFRRILLRKCTITLCFFY